MFLRRDVTKHGTPVPPDHGRSDPTSYMIVPRSHVRGQRTECIKGSLVTPLDLFLHVFLDHVHGNVARALVHYLDSMLPSPRGQSALRLEFGKLSLIVSVCNRTRTQTIPNGKRNVVGSHNLTNFVPLFIKKIFFMVGQTPLCHD